MDYSEELVKQEDLLERMEAETTFYPNGTFAYNQLHPSVLRFKHPV